MGGAGATVESQNSRPEPRTPQPETFVLPSAPFRVREKKEQLTYFEDFYLKAKALTVSYVPCSLDSGPRACRRYPR